MAELIKYDLEDLYDALHAESITTDILWDLTKEQIRQIGLNVGQTLRYLKAKEDHQAALPTSMI